MSYILPALSRSIPTVDSRSRRQTLMLYLALVWKRPRANRREIPSPRKKKKKKEGPMRNRRGQSIPYRSNGGIQQHGIEALENPARFWSINLGDDDYLSSARPSETESVGKAAVVASWLHDCICSRSDWGEGARHWSGPSAAIIFSLFSRIIHSERCVAVLFYIFMFGFFTLILHLYRVAEYA